MTTITVNGDTYVKVDDLIKETHSLMGLVEDALNDTDYCELTEDIQDIFDDVFFSVESYKDEIEGLI